MSEQQNQSPRLTATEIQMMSEKLSDAERGAMEGVRLISHYYETRIKDLESDATVLMRLLAVCVTRLGGQVEVTDDEFLTVARDAALSIEGDKINQRTHINVRMNDEQQQAPEAKAGPGEPSRGDASGDAPRSNLGEAGD